VHCTLWDEFAFKMQQFLDTHDPALPVVIIFQLCKLKKYLGKLVSSHSLLIFSHLGRNMIWHISLLLFFVCFCYEIGFMGISNSFHGSKLYLNADLAEATNYIERLSLNSYIILHILINHYFYVTNYSIVCL
jgi:hypothetical protein